jgi:hypothetical protein
LFSCDGGVLLDDLALWIIDKNRRVKDAEAFDIN